MLQISKYDPDLHCTGFLDNTSRCSNSLKRFSIPNITYLLFVKNQNFVLYQMTGKASQVPWLIGETSHDEHCRRILIKSLAGFWWGVLGKLHHWRITQVQIRTTSQNIICPKLSPAATLETKRTLTSGWNDWLQGFLEPMRKIPQKWEFLQQKKTLSNICTDLLWYGTDGKRHPGRIVRALQVCLPPILLINATLRGKLRLHQGVPKVVINSSNEDLSLSIADEMPSR